MCYTRYTMHVLQSTIGRIKGNEEVFMKKKLVNVLLVSALICSCLTACGESEEPVQMVVESIEGDDATTSEAVTELEATDAAAGAEGEVCDYDYAAQVDFLFDHSSWLSYSEFVTYAFTDLDDNGRMEVIVCEKSAEGAPAQPRFYEISADYDDVKECTFETNCYIYTWDDDTCEGVYVDPETGTRSYLMKDSEPYEGGELFYYYELTLSNGAVAQYAVCSQNPLGYYNYRFESIDPEQLNVDEEIANYFEGKNKESASGLHFDPLEGDGMHGKMADSINAFLK